MKELKENNAFSMQKEEPDADDLWCKYYDADEGKVKKYIENLRLCPVCKAYDVGYSHTNFEGTKHIHLCNCSWRSKEYEGRAY